MTSSLSVPERVATEAMAATPISVTTRVVTKGMKLINAKERASTRALLAAKMRWIAWG